VIRQAAPVKGQYPVLQVLLTIGQIQVMNASVSPWALRREFSKRAGGGDTFI
jgi:hypothetical protein